MRIWLPISVVAYGIAACVSAQQPVIFSFESDGLLTWSNASPDAFASIERLTDLYTTGSAVTVTETLAVSDGSTASYDYTVEHLPIVNPSVTISDGTYSWNDVTLSSTNPPVLWGMVVYPSGTVSAIYLSQVPTAGTPIEVEYSYLPVSTGQEWLSVHTQDPTSGVCETIVDMSEETSLFRVANDLSPMALIPGGSNSGTNPLAPGEVYWSSYPETYSLSVDSFYMGRCEVTNDEMVEVMQWAHDHGRISATTATVQNLQGDPQELLNLDDPQCRVTWDGSSFGMKAWKGSGYLCLDVTWYGAAAYCNYRSEMEGRTPCYNLSNWSCNFSARGYRLPTSEEWEYAGRGGAVSKRFPWGGNTISHSQANYYAESWSDYDLSSGGWHPLYGTGEEPYTSPVRAFSPNTYGLYDMAGNVSEWCYDWHPDYVGSRRVLRGGTSGSRADFCRVAYSGKGWPDLSGDTGFRVVLSAVE